MAITITQQPDADAHFSAFHPLPIVCTSNRSGIVNIKCIVVNEDTSITYATIRKPLDIGTTDTFTIDIYPILISVVGFDDPLFGAHQICSNSIKRISVYLTEEYLSGGLIVTGSFVQSNIFYVHNTPVLNTDTSINYFYDRILQNSNSKTIIPIGASDNYFIQAIKTGDFDHLKVNVVYDDGTTNSFNDPISWSNNERWNISCGTHYIVNILGATSNIASYSVGIADSGNVIVSDEIFFKVNDCCAISEKRIAYLNQRGAFDYITFKSKQVLEFDTEKELWTRKKYIGSGYSFQTNYAQSGLFKDKSIDIIKVESRPLSESLAYFLRELLQSKAVFLEFYYPIQGTTGSNLVINGGFSSSSNWILSIDSWATMAITGNKIVVTDSTTGNAVGLLTQTGILTIGKTYKITAHVSNNNNVEINVDGAQLANLGVNGSNLYTYFTASSVDLVIEFNCGNAPAGVHFDNVTVYEAAYYQGTIHEPILINDGKFTLIDQVKRENKLSISYTKANKNYNGIG
jgi:hypothetical protein